MWRRSSTRPVSCPRAWSRIPSSALRRYASVRSWKFLIFTYASFRSKSFSSTETTRITSRISAKLRGSVQEARSALITTLVPGGPISERTASASCQPRTGSPSISTSLSPGLNPARAAGVSSSGATTTTSSPRLASSSPTPPYSPSVSSFKAEYARGSMKLEWGSSVRTIPSIAP